MERLTEKRDTPLVMPMWPGDSRSLRIYNRLAAIEDILGDEYELDAVAWVVRCKNCRYYRDAKINEKGFLICPASGMEITENDFCSYGESPKVAMKARELDEQYLL